MSNPRARCHVCDRLPAAPEDWAHADDCQEPGCQRGADRCYEPLGAACASRRVDWRARALASEAALRALVQAWDEGAEHTIDCRACAGQPCDCWVGDVHAAVERARELIR